MEGSTGKGNDQYRMHNVFKMFAPNLEILVPVRDFDLTRSKVKLYKGNITIAQRQSDTSLFTPEIRSIKARGFDQRWCANAAKVRGGFKESDQGLLGN